MRAAGDDQDAVRLRDFFVVLRGRTAGRSCVAAGGLYGGDLQQRARAAGQPTCGLRRTPYRRSQKSRRPARR